jgi:NADH:ubiquinone reductase (H+-translocating)
MTGGALHVVIVGGGFGGLRVARSLRRSGLRVTLLDRHNHHTFQPLLYQVATAALNPSDIAAPIRRVLRHQKNVSVLLGEVTAVHPDRKTITFKKTNLAEAEVEPEVELPYDALVLATGAMHSYFGHDEWAPFAPGLKTIEDALEIRRRVLFAFEAAEREDDPKEREAWLTFVVVGGGATGVELAGALADIARRTLARDFRRIDPAAARILLLEGTPDVLPPFVPKLRAKAREQLVALGAEVRTGAMVTGVDEHGVSLEGGERIRARTVLWGAGVAASPLGRSLGVPLDRAGRVLVEPDLTVPGHPEIYVIGDLASLTQDGKPVPGVARAALDEGEHTAENLLRVARGEPLLPFRYRNLGELATIGRAAAVADFGRIKLSGYVAWLAWLFIHILFLIGFRNRFFVVLEWIWSYLTFDRGARLITGRAPPPPAGPAPPAGRAK